MGHSKTISTSTLQKIYQHCEEARAALVAGGTKKKTVESEGWKAFLYRFDSDKAAKDLTWALGYWLDERDPIPVKRWPRKCFACPLNAVGLCEHALQEPDPGFKVQQGPNERVFVYR